MAAVIIHYISCYCISLNAYFISVSLYFLFYLFKLLILFNGFGLSLFFNNLIENVTIPS